MKATIAKLVLQATLVFCKWIIPSGMTFACALNISLPFNTMWTLDYIVGILELQENYTTAFWKGFTLILNYIVWKLMALQGYWLVVDVLIGVLSLTYCQEMALR